MGTPFLYFHVQPEPGYLVKLAARFQKGWSLPLLGKLPNTKGAAYNMLRWTQYFEALADKTRRQILALVWRHDPRRVISRLSFWFHGQRSHNNSESSLQVDS